MVEDNSILDGVYKICQACGQKRTLRNYRLLKSSEFGDGITLIADKFSKVCRCCEKHPEKQLKANRLEILREKMKRFKENEHKRLEKIKARELALEEGFKVYEK